MPRSSYGLVAAALLCAPFDHADGQREPTHSTTWVTVGLGRAKFGGFTELGGALSASRQSQGHWVVGARLAGAWDFPESTFGSTGDVVAVWDAGLLVGQGTHPGFLHAS